ncbi:hypothetical protein [Candidimonas nitroreducens]|uniref:Uncharacterized protein n=1 Tax=Candidimonas nitroreducens TaxID=683354 RepID=A0A225MYY3_9BURK|nr:hypothetical protein [Candidimonas nitroreducens]OWT66324.1 hypothetical protein CEY11_00870 [Candidimonas nitroreducens]
MAQPRARDFSSTSQVGEARKRQGDEAEEGRAEVGLHGVMGPVVFNLTIQTGRHREANSFLQFRTGIMQASSSG